MAIEKKLEDKKQKKCLEVKLDHVKKEMCEPIQKALNEDYNSPDYKCAEENLTMRKPEIGCRRTGFHPMRK
jgi:hypothetical protein